MKTTAQRIKATVGALLLAAVALFSVACTGDGMNVQDGTVDEGTSSSTTITETVTK